MASIKDIANHLGISPSTVSIIINGKAKERKISEATQKKVIQAMKDLNYIPNISAKAMRQGSSQEHTIALFCSFDFRNTMMTRFLSGIQNKISESDDNTKIIIFPYTSGQLNKERSHFTGIDFHAAIIANANKKDLDFLSSLSCSFPIILYNRILDGYSSVNVHDALIGKASAKHLLEKGYKRPAVLFGSYSFPGASTRITSFVSTMKSHGILIPDEYYYQVQNSIEGAANFANNLLNSGCVLPDSIWCSSDNLAYGFLSALTAQGISVPEQIGLISVGNTEPFYAKYSVPSLTVINIPIEHMAECCYNLLRKYQISTTQEIQQLFFETELIERDSTQKH